MKHSLLATITMLGAISAAAPEAQGQCPLSFADAATYGVGRQPGQIAVADFNGDGRPDLAVANSSTSNVSILLGNGNGTFPENPTNYETGSAPWVVAAGDFNADGRPDLAFASHNRNEVLIGLGNGDGGVDGSDVEAFFERWVDGC